MVLTGLDRLGLSHLDPDLPASELVLGRARSQDVDGLRV